MFFLFIYFDFTEYFDLLSASYKKKKKKLLKKEKEILNYLQIHKKYIHECM